MAHVVGKITMKLLTVAVGIPVGIASKRVVARLWVAARPEEPAHDLKDPAAHWADVIGYAALAAAGGVAAKLITRRGAESTYRSLTGLEPPPPAPTKEQKRLAKAEQATQQSATKLSETAQAAAT
jgi:hypothetical protein